MNDAAADIANEIGARFDTAGSDPNEVLSVISHATLGCAASAAEGTGCAGGAIGGASSAIIAPVIRDALYDGTQSVTYSSNGDGSVTETTNYNNSAINTITTALATAIGATASGLAGANPNAGATWAENEVTNNTLSPKYSYLAFQKAACSGQPLSCYQAMQTSLTQAYYAAQLNTYASCSSQGSAACQTALSDQYQIKQMGVSNQWVLNSYDEGEWGSQFMSGIGLASAIGLRFGGAASGTASDGTGSTGQPSTVGDEDLPNVYDNQVPSPATKSGFVGTTNQPVENLFGETLTSPILSHTPGLQNGVLGEEVGLQTLSEETNLKFEALQNNSGNGADGIAIDPNTDTIWVAEVKSSQNGVNAAANATGNPATKLTNWINQSLNPPAGSAWQSQPASNQVLAQEIQDAINSGYQVKGIQVQVGVPAPGSTGVSQVKINSWTSN